MRHALWLLLASALAWAGEPKPDCLSAYGKSACGYHCVGAYSQVKCAATPQGVCTSGSGQVLCFDPPITALPGGKGTDACLQLLGLSTASPKSP